VRGGAGVDLTPLPPPPRAYSLERYKAGFEGLELDGMETKNIQIVSKMFPHGSGREASHCDIGGKA
jgi:hypothetical protein